MSKDVAPIAWWEMSTGQREPIRLDIEYVREELRKQVLSQTELGKRAGVSKQMMSDLLAGKRAPSPSTVRDLAAALDVLPRKLILDARSAQQSAPMTAGAA